MSGDATGRIDGFPYRHRVADVMTSPLITVAPTATLEDAARVMADKGVSSVLVDGAEPGIVTERDVVEAVARRGVRVLAEPVDAVAIRPVHGVPAAALIYVALGRMARLGVRHLLAFDGAGHPAGMVTARALLKLRAGRSLALGDEIAVAHDALDLRRVRDALPALAEGLLADGLDARAIAAVIGSVYRDMTGRAAELGAEALEADGQGPAPAPWCCLVLGSVGRGDSLLAADQDNALIHGGAEGDAWFAALGERIAATLDAAGLPLCQGGIMAARAEWRHTLAGWRERIARWVARAEGESLLAVDIFFDFAPVAGDTRLAATLRAEATTAARAPMLLSMLAHELTGFTPPIGLFGRIETEQGRVDLKLNGLHPIVAAARVLALKHGVAETTTAVRLERAHAAGAIPESDLVPIGAAHEFLMRLVLEQQIADLAAGRAPGTKVAVGALSTYRVGQLKDALRRAAAFADGIKDAVFFT